jgi:hypothetical protein
MGRFAVAAAVALVATAASVSSANAVPSFVRQTGLTCNQCHITQLGTPDFTFTGKKFRLNGYRAPYVAEKIEAGEEGALNGRRLVLSSFFSPLSFRIGQQFLSQSKSSSQVGGTPTVASAVTNRPFSNFSMFYAGGIGDHIGFWNEIYFDAAGPGAGGTGSTFRTMGMDEWDLRLVFNPGYDNIVGIGTNSQTFSYLAGFGPARSGAAGNSLQRGGVGQAHTPYGNIGAYALIKDRVVVAVGVQGGEDNYSLSGMNYQSVLAVAINNSDYNQMWWNFQIKAGNDAIPIVTNTDLSPDRTQFEYTDAVSGVSATRGPVGDPLRTSYRSEDIGDFVRTTTELEYSFVDRGPHSLWTSVGVAYNDETYADGANYKSFGWGFSVRYLYNRTFGFVYGLNDYTKREFTDRNGLTHEVSKPAMNPFSGSFHYKVAQNFRLQLSWGFLSKGGGNRLDDTRQYNRDGWNWGLNFDFLF